MLNQEITIVLLGGACDGKELIIRYDTWKSGYIKVPVPIKIKWSPEPELTTMHSPEILIYKRQRWNPGWACFQENWAGEWGPQYACMPIHKWTWEGYNW